MNSINFNKRTKRVPLIQHMIHMDHMVFARVDLFAGLHIPSRYKPMWRIFASFFRTILTLPFIYSLIIFETAHASDFITLDQNSLNGKYIGAQTQYLIDTEKNLKIEDMHKPQVASRFNNSRKDALNFGFTDLPIWIRFTVFNPTDNEIEWYLENEYNIFDWIELYIPLGDGKYEKKVTSDFHLPYHQRDVRHHNYPVFKSLDKPGAHTFYMRFLTRNAAMIPLRIWSKAPLLDHIINSKAIFAMVYASFVLGFIYNLFILFSVRTLSYLFYLFQLASIVILFLVLYGHGFVHLWPTKNLFNYSLVISMPLVIISGILFTRAFLDTSRLLPRWDKIIRLMLIYTSILLVLNLMLPYSISLPLTVYSIQIPLISVFITGPLCLFKGSRPAVYYCIAYFIGSLAASYEIMKSIGVLSIHHLSIWTLPFSVVSMQLLFAMGLADRINTLKNELADLNLNLEHKILERTKALRDAQKDLIENAHKSGMADIASNILHNVGNILNSVKTTVYKIRDSLVKSPVPKLEMANDMLKENNETLSDFLINDPKGKKLPEFYFAIGKAFKEHNTQILQDTDHLNSRIDEIAHIVAAQQGYAKATAVTEKLNVSDVVNVAVNLQADALSQQDVKVVREFPPVPEIPVQKGKLIHVLVALICNARDAMQYCKAHEEKKLTFSVKKNNDSVSIQVTDTGHGIFKEDKIKIFNPGFTTKKGKRRNSLHCCANYMSEMGGAIEGESDGEGQGATFTLKLPLSEKNETVLEKKQSFN